MKWGVWKHTGVNYSSHTEAHVELFISCLYLAPSQILGSHAVLLIAGASIYVPNSSIP